MPAWWSKKGSRKKEETPSPKSDTARGKRPITRLSDDYGLTRNSPRVSRDLGSGSTGFCGFDSDDRKGHPLPLPRVNDHGINGVGSVSSVSSHGSCCEDQIIGIDQHLGQFGGYRSPVDHRGRREIKFTTESRGLDARSRSPGPSSGNHGLGSKAPGSPSLLPLHQFLGTTSLDSPVGGSEEVKSQWHPLPLPPSSPTSPKLCTRSNGSVENPLPLPPSSPTSPKRCTRSTGSVENLRVMPSKWKKGRLLGRGTFGHVYLGFNCERGQMCAIKEVRNVSDDQTAKECLKQLNQEINLLSQLSHPNIVRYYGSELSEETLSVYLEYVSGGSINKLLQQYGAFGEPVIQNYTRQILSGLVYLHGRNTMHRDIKGANILVDPNGEIKLADFGMAKHITAYTSMLSFKGSPYWMAPEVVMNANGYSSLVDIWSLGCTILEMATSKPPWSQYEGVAAIFKVGNSKDMPYIPDHLSSDAKDFIRLCLQREPSLRPTAVKLLEHPFVKDQATTRVANISVTRGAFPRTFDGCQTPPALDLHSDRTSTTVGEVDYLARPTFTNSRASRNPRDDVQGITSLPVSPCSSPLRQRRSAHRNFFHSPPQPAYTLAGQSNYNINDHPSTSITRNTTYAHNPYLDFPLLKGQTPAASSRTRLI